MRLFTRSLAHSSKKRECVRNGETEAHPFRFYFSYCTLALSALVWCCCRVSTVDDDLIEAKRVIGGTRGIRKIGAGLLILGTASLFFDHSAAFNGNQIFYSEKPW